MNRKKKGCTGCFKLSQDLDDARYCFQGKRFNLACFLSQQAAEKAVKAIIYAQGEEILGAGGLDKYYIPTRYPNGLPGGLPFEAFDENDAKKAIAMATRGSGTHGSAMKKMQD